jgi:hypothetical protein
MAQFGVSTASQAGLGGQDTTQQLQKMFTGRVIGAPAIPYGGVAGKVFSSTATTCIVIVPLPSNQSFTFTCTYEPRPQATNDPPYPPTGARPASSHSPPTEITLRG